MKSQPCGHLHKTCIVIAPTDAPTRVEKLSQDAVSRQSTAYNDSRMSSLLGYQFQVDSQL